MNLASDARGFPSLWADNVNDMNAESLLDLYDKQATLMPTFSPHTVGDRAALISYFDQLFSRDSLSVTLQEDTVGAFHLVDQLDLVFGVYSFAFEVDRTLLNFPARFTFVLDLGRSAPILHHHSSQIPKMLS